MVGFGVERRVVQHPVPGQTQCGHEQNGSELRGALVGPSVTVAPAMKWECVSTVAVRLGQLRAVCSPLERATKYREAWRLSSPVASTAAVGPSWPSGQLGPIPAISRRSCDLRPRWPVAPLPPPNRPVAARADNNRRIVNQTARRTEHDQPRQAKLVNLRRSADREIVRTPGRPRPRGGLWWEPAGRHTSNTTAVESRSRSSWPTGRSATSPARPSSGQ